MSDYEKVKKYAEVREGRRERERGGREGGRREKEREKEASNAPDNMSMCANCVVSTKDSNY